MQLVVLLLCLGMVKGEIDPPSPPSWPEIDMHIAIGGIFLFTKVCPFSINRQSLSGNKELWISYKQQMIWMMVAEYLDNIADLAAWSYSLYDIPKQEVGALHFFSFLFFSFLP
jgi:hypothetical protein